MSKVEFGKLGEDTAIEFLTRKEYQILDRNFKIRGGEIDIVAKKEDSIIFVEVKTRKNEDWQAIEDSVTEKKRNLIENAAKEWFFREKIAETFWQIDFVGIIMGSNSQIQKIVHLEDI